LQARWTEEQVEKVNQCLVKGKLLDSPFGLFETRIDLRGLPLKEFIKGKTLEGINFTFMTRVFAAQIGMSKVNDCIFSGAELDINLGKVFKNCVFEKAKMKEVCLRGEFEDCSFEGANMSSCKGDSVKFINCSFKRANLTKVQLTNCLFEKCTFDGARMAGGSLHSSEFITNHPDSQQLGNTIMERCAFL